MNASKIYQQARRDGHPTIRPMLSIQEDKTSVYKDSKEI